MDLWYINMIFGFVLGIVVLAIPIAYKSRKLSMQLHIARKDLRQAKNELNAMFYTSMDIARGGGLIGTNRKQAAQSILDAYEQARKERAK